MVSSRFSERAAPGGDQAAQKLIRRHPFLRGQGGELATARRRELLSGPIFRGRCTPQDFAIKTEPVGVLSHDLALGAVPGGVYVASLGHLPKQAEVPHDHLF